MITHPELGFTALMEIQPISGAGSERIEKSSLQINGKQYVIVYCQDKEPPWKDDVYYAPIIAAAKNLVRHWHVSMGKGIAPTQLSPMHVLIERLGQALQILEEK